MGGRQVTGTAARASASAGLAVFVVHHLAPARLRLARRPPSAVRLRGLAPVIVCHCHRINDARIDQVLTAGADGVRGVVRATRAGSGCGGCIPMLRRLCTERATVLELCAHSDEDLAG